MSIIVWPWLLTDHPCFTPARCTPGADATRLAAAKADCAMAWLQQAIAAGYTNAAHIAKDTDLDALRDREDFKKLVAELEAGEVEKASKK